jgi:hypothetical protein
MISIIGMLTLSACKQYRSCNISPSSLDTSTRPNLITPLINNRQHPVFRQCIPVELLTPEIPVFTMSTPGPPSELEQKETKRQEQ